VNGGSKIVAYEPCVEGKLEPIASTSSNYEGKKNVNGRQRKINLRIKGTEKVRRKPQTGEFRGSTRVGR